MAIEKFENFVVTKKAFHDGGRVYPGEVIREQGNFRASWAVPEDEYEGDEEAPSALDGTVKEVRKQVDEIDSVTQLRRLVDQETSGARRKGVLSHLSDRIANLITQQADAAAEASDDLIG